DLDQHVAGEELALGTALLAGAHLDHFLGRHQHVTETLLHFVTHDAVAQCLRHRLLETRIGVDDVPTLHCHLPQWPRNSWVNFWITKSNPPSSRLSTTTTRITTQVMRMASWRVGHTTLRSSKRDSDRNDRTQ